MSLLNLRPLTTLRHLAHPSLPTTRSKHSATQVKRLFKNNPARLRLLKKATASNSSPSNTNSTQKAEQTVAIPQRTFPPVYQPKFLKNGWSAPPPEGFVRPEYPFFVGRTGNKPYGAVGFLPVYRDVRIHGTKRTTLIRNISGSLPSFLTELTAVLQIPPPKKILYTHPPTGGLTGAATNGTGSYKSNASRHGGGEAGRGVCREYPIRVRAGGVVEVFGDCSRDVKRWLAGLGF